MNKLGTVLALALVTFTASAFAEEKAATTAPSSGPKYGSAGCGLGSMLIGNKPGFVQLFAATTNGTSASQTFGISSGTSNCDSGSGGSASAKVFIAANREALSKDIARGSGETVQSLAAIAGCGDARAVGASLQRNFKSIFPNDQASADQVSGAILQTLRSDATLACGNAG